MRSEWECVHVICIEWDPPVSLTSTNPSLLALLVGPGFKVMNINRLWNIK